MQSEEQRLQRLMHFENEAWAAGYSNIAGIDEAGRGPLAGPVVAAACILPISARFYGIDDSKKLSPLQRERLFKELNQNESVYFSLGIVSHQDIDRLNIYQATIQAMLIAVAGLSPTPDYLLIDGMHLSGTHIPRKKIIKGDALSQSIAAASIIAKVTRDRLMQECHAQWPVYGFNQNKGYGTKQHLAAIEKHGACPIHRLTFSPFALSLASHF